MSGTIGGIGGGIGLLQALATDSGAIRDQLAVATQQMATGKVASSYAGLGAGARTSLNLTPQIAQLQTWSSNIDSATARLGVTQSALTSITSIASTFLAKAATLNGLMPGVTASVAAQAKTALVQVAQLLNSKVGDTYVFAGQDTANPPVPDTTAATLVPALLGSDTATPPFSATLGTAVPTVQTGPGERAPVGVLANQNTLSVSAAPTTGSYMRDIMRALATLANTTDGPGLQAIAADTSTRLQSAISAASSEGGALGDVQAGLVARKTALTETQTTLSAQVSTVENVDLAATLTRVTQLQTQLQASYQLIAGVRDLTLSKYI
jgi:flagellar hook-associated protein 3 FlgL